MIIIAHNIRSLHNVGAFFRSAEAFGAEKIYLTGFTATPPRKEIAKVALGSQNHVPWEHRENLLELIAELKEEGRNILAIETGENVMQLSDVEPVGNEVLLMGNEVEGLEEEEKAACDKIVMIEMPGRKRSLNVSVAAGIALFWFSQGIR